MVERGPSSWLQTSYISHMAEGARGLSEALL